MLKNFFVKSNTSNYVVIIFNTFNYYSVFVDLSDMSNNLMLSFRVLLLCCLKSNNFIIYKKLKINRFIVIFRLFFFFSDCSFCNLANNLSLSISYLISNVVNLFLNLGNCKFLTNIINRLWSNIA
jgi:hypothetical protein